MKRSKTILRFAGRDIIKVTLPDGSNQGFYRSTGHNRGMPNTWLPFDGLATYPYGWFDKTKYCRRDLPPYLYRLGTELLASVSKRLGAANIPTGEEVSRERVNEFLEYDEVAIWNRTLAKLGEDEVKQVIEEALNPKKPSEITTELAKRFSYRQTKWSGATHKYKVTRLNSADEWPPIEHLVWLCDGTGNWGGKIDNVAGNEMDISIYVD